MTVSRDSEEEIVLPDTDSPIVLWRDGVCQIAPKLPYSAILPGAFNPIHEGHRQLRDAAAAFLGCSVLFELSIHNADKPTLSAHEVHKRLKTISDEDVLVTNAALFVDKADLFPGHWFVVGFDTAERILNPQYYNHDLGQRDQFLRKMSAAKIQFLVAGRVDLTGESGDFRTSDQLSAGHDYCEMFVELPESCFRLDLSSTMIRRQQRCADDTSS
ncbi:MAG: hypothetical protein MK102_01055 [Fuerstiella sp.]|nr:hypothetical protein [Fuerstiella sp.]